jgi:transcriptional regulator with XRE-family HTH domain
MPKLKPRVDGLPGEKKFFLTDPEQQLLRRLGHQISRDLARSEMKVEDLAYKASIARSTLREILAGRSNPRVLTLNAIASALGYSSLVDLCQAALSETRLREIAESPENRRQPVRL